MENYDYLIQKGKQELIEKNVVGAIIKNNEEKILIVRRNADDFMGGIEELPSGNMEKGENIFNALKREVKEETNLDMEEILFYVDSFDYKSSKGKNARQYNFAVKVKNFENINLTEHDVFHWQTVEEIMENKKITKEVKNIFKVYLEKIKKEI